MFALFTYYKPPLEPTVGTNNPQQQEVYDTIIDTSLIHASPSEELVLLGRPELGPTFSKVNLFALTQYEQLLYLDADTLPVQPIWELLEMPVSDNQIYASPDCGWPDIFNSGVFMIKPSFGVYELLLDIVRTSEKPSFDGADQGLLNEFFTVAEGREWIRLPFTYNVTPSGGYEYLPAFKFFASDVKLIHYIGSTKPWDCDEWENLAMRGKWWGKYREFYGCKPIMESLRGIEPYFYNVNNTIVEAPIDDVPTGFEHVENEEYYEENQPHQDEEYREMNEVLLNPQSYQYFETVAIEEHWDPAYAEPPKDGRPEAESFPQDLHYDNQWEDNGVFVEEYEEPLPPPLFPWEFETREKAERVFDPAVGPDTWDDMALIQRIKDMQMEEHRKQSPLDKTDEELERLKEIEVRYTGDIAEDVAEDAIEDGVLQQLEEATKEEEEEMKELKL